MKSALLIATFLGVLAAGLAATMTGQYSDPKHPGKCVISPELILSPGVHNDVEGCARIECHRGGFADTYTCGVQYAGPDCTLGDSIKPDADYPDCCERKIDCSNAHHEK